MSTETIPSTVITPEAFLEHWQGHRRLTRRMIEAFPEDKLFTFAVGSMRPFGLLAWEMISMAAPMVYGVVTDKWQTVAELLHHSGTAAPGTRAELLKLWDESTKEIDTFWPQITPGRFQETTKAFGQYEGQVFGLLLYVIDNEIHHRGQGYVYLRALAIEPPPFYERH